MTAVEKPTLLKSRPFSLVHADATRPSLSDLRHPQYVLNQENWEKWRLTYLGGSRFLKRYLKKLSRREDDQDFRDRQQVSYVPAFAKSAINEVKNSIFGRMRDIAREGGPVSYQASVAGLDGGVDLLGSSMNTFIGRDVLPELMTMARVGVYVDMPPLSGTSTMAEKGNARPYLYWYRAEDIRSWDMMRGQTGDPTEFRALLLRDSTYDIDQHWVLPYEVTTRYRYLWIDPEDGFVNCQFYTEMGDPIYPDGYNNGEVVKLPIRRIPFVMFELSDSLLADVADYQIALLNLASSDMSFALKSNHPFYTEQVDWRTESPYMKSGSSFGTAQTAIDPTNATVIVSQEKQIEIKTGSMHGRRYPVGTERPGFIAPPTAPLEASMKKQDQLKDEIRLLVMNALGNLQPRDGGTIGESSIEAGLSYIGIELEHGERKIADFWAMYENEDPGSVNYPEQYSIMSETDRQEQVSALKELMPMVPSLTFRREVAKRIVRITLGTRVGNSKLREIESEIDKDPVVLGDPQVIETDVVNGLVDLETASAARGYPKGVVEKAKADHAERLARIAEHQAKPNLDPNGSDPGARGVPDQSGNPKAGDEEKTASQKDQTTRDQVKPRVRGEGKQ